MNTTTTPYKKFDTKVLLSTLWIVVMINLLNADELARTSARSGASIPQLMLGRKWANNLPFLEN